MTEDHDEYGDAPSRFWIDEAETQRPQGEAPGAADEPADPWDKMILMASCALVLAAIGLALLIIVWVASGSFWIGLSSAVLGIVSVWGLDKLSGGH